MKAIKFPAILALLFFTAGLPGLSSAAEGGDLILSLKYFFYNNKIPFVQVNTKTKVEKKLQPVPGMTVVVYLDSLSDNNKIGQVLTNDNGNATIAIPPSLKTSWEGKAKHTLMAKSTATKAYEETETDVELTQAKLVLDTLNDGDARSLVATLMERSGDTWTPVKDADVKLGVKRLGGILSAGTDASYTTDETGKATAAFERDTLPGDKDGNVILTAKVEDNDTYGNLVVEMKAPWGAKFRPGHDPFNDRTLWSTRNKAPYWLLFLANSIIIIVWGVLIYLIVQIFKMRKLGTS